VGLVGRCPQSQAASVTYGCSFAVATFLTLPVLGDGAAAVGAVLMGASVVAYFARK